MDDWATVRKGGGPKTGPATTTAKAPAPTGQRNAFAAFTEEKKVKRDKPKEEKWSKEEKKEAKKKGNGTWEEYEKEVVKILEEFVGGFDHAEACFRLTGLQLEPALQPRVVVDLLVRAVGYRGEEARTGVLQLVA